MNWNELTTTDQIEKIFKDSFDQPQVIFKHSTRCNISSVVKNRLDKSAPPENIAFHYLDLIKFRPISNEVMDKTGVMHQSPQVLLIQDGKCIYDESHTSIHLDEILSNAGLF